MGGEMCKQKIQVKYSENLSSERIDRISNSIMNWSNLVQTLKEYGEQVEDRGVCFNPFFDRVDMYCRIIKALEMELQFGETHCACCLLPLNSCARCLR